MKELIEYVAKHLVDEPDAVQVDEKTSGDMHVIELRVAEPDRGKVIGKKGRTAHAMRTLLNATNPQGSTKLEILD